MRIGVLGAGRMATVFSHRWHAAGHELFIGARDAGRSAALAAQVGPEAGSGSLREAAVFGDAVLVAIWPVGVIPALLQAGAAEGTLAGRVVIDCNNPVETETFTLTTGVESLAETIARIAPGARVVKAFNQCEASVWAMTPPAFDGRRLSVPLCGDDPAAKAVVAQLAGDLGCLPLDVGPLHRARYVEAMAALVIALLWRGGDPRTVFSLTTATGPDAGAAAPGVGSGTVGSGGQPEQGGLDEH
jgi:predicted dinucleotide-binding enzyme